MHSYVAEARDNIRCDPLFGITWRRNVSGTACKLLDEDVTTYQEQLARYLKKSFQHIRNVWQVTWRRCSSVSGTSGKLLEEDVTTYQEHLASYLCYNVAGTSCMLLEEDMATYQERLASYFKKMLQSIRNVLQVTWRRCYDVAGTSCLCLHRSMNVITPPHPTPPHPTGNWSWKNSAAPVSAGQQARWWGCCAWPHVPAPCPQVLP